MTRVPKLGPGCLCDMVVHMYIEINVEIPTSKQIYISVI